MTSDETTPLLGTNRVDQVGQQHERQAQHENVERSKSSSWWCWRQRWQSAPVHPTLLLVFALNMLLYSGQTMALAPRMQMYEEIVCRDFSSRDGGGGGGTGPLPLAPGSGRCKDADVQAEVAFVLGMEEFLTVFLSVLSIPYSFMADKYGHGPVLSLSLLGIVLEMIWPLFVCHLNGYLSIYWVWLGIVFEAIGGGITVTVTMFNLVLLNFVSAESRTRTFLYLTASSLVSRALGQFVTTRMMHSDIWLPAYIGCGLNILALVLSFSLVSQTRAKPTASAPSSDDDECEAITSRNGRSAEELGRVAPQFLRRVGSTLRSNPEVVVVLISAFAFPLGEDSMFTVILLYVSKRYGWSIGDANMLAAFGTVVMLVTYLVLLPVFGNVLLEYGGVTSYVRDRTIVQTEGVLLLAGALCTAFAPTVVWAAGGVVIMSLGMAVVTILRSLVTDLMRPQDVTLVYSMVTMMMRIGSAVAGPIFAWSFGFGLRLGPVWTGLPFVVAAAFFLAGTIALGFLPKEPRSRDGEEETD
ncbi:MFS general substrate transporter [Thermothelomyces heterothallicus CBS 203.75]